MLKPCRALTMWLALEEVDESNGCISYVELLTNKGFGNIDAPRP